MPDEIAKDDRDQVFSIVLCGLLHVQTVVSVHGPVAGTIALCARVDGLGTVYA